MACTIFYYLVIRFSYDFPIWLVVWNMFSFPIYWDFRHPNWIQFFRGEGMPPTRCVDAFWLQLTIARCQPCWNLFLEKSLKKNWRKSEWSTQWSTYFLAFRFSGFPMQPLNHNLIPLNHHFPMVFLRFSEGFPICALRPRAAEVCWAEPKLRLALLDVVEPAPFRPRPRQFRASTEPLVQRSSPLVYRGFIGDLEWIYSDL